MSFPLISTGASFAFAGAVSGWGGGFESSCNRVLGNQQSGLTGALFGGLVGSLAGGGNPLFGLAGAGIGGLLERSFSRRNNCCQGNHHHQNHHHCGSYPSQYGGSFGGQQFGGFQCSPNFGNQYGGGFGQYGGGFGGQQFGGVPFNANTVNWGPMAGFGNQFPGGAPGGAAGYYAGGGGFGAQGGGFGTQFPGGGSPFGGQWGQQWGGGSGCFSPGQNFNFGNQCCPSQCCPGQRPPDGQLKQEGGEGKPIEYKTSGGYTIKVDKHTITVTDPKGKNTVEHWGDPHENLNGKHLKDWEGKQRSIILEDGTKITMTAQGPQGVTESMSIYDGRQNVQIDNNNNKITHRSLNQYDTMKREYQQYDGETSIFRTNNRTGVATYSNIYNQDSAFNVTRSYQQLGTTGGYANPKQVNDLYDDPRLAHT